MSLPCNRNFAQGLLAAGSLAILLGHASAHAAGFYISEVGTPASLGTAGAANVTNTWGPDSTWAKPAGLVHAEGDPMTAGLQAIVPYMKWDPGLAVGYGNTDYYRGWTLGVSYESSPAEDGVRTIDLPVDSGRKLASAYGRRLASGRSLSVGATLQIFGDAEVDQTNQGVRFAGEFNDFYVLFAGVTMRF